MSAKTLHVLDMEGGLDAPAARGHAAGCEECAKLLEGADLLGSCAPPPTGGSQAAREASLRASLSELSQKRAPAPWWAGLLLLLFLQSIPLQIAWEWDLLQLGNSAPVGRVVGIAVAILLAAVSGAWLALSPRLRRPWGLLRAAAVALGVAVILGGSGETTRPLVDGLVRCVVLVAAFGILTTVAATMLLHHTAPNPRRTAAAGLAGAAIPLFVIHLHCPEGTSLHLAAGHVIPGLLLIAFAFWMRPLVRQTGYVP